MKIHKEVIELLKECVDRYPVAEMILGGLTVRAKIKNFSGNARHLGGKVIVEIAMPDRWFSGLCSNNFTFISEDGSRASMHIAHIEPLSPLELLAKEAE